MEKNPYPQTIEACADYAEKAGLVISAIIQERPELIHSPAFGKFINIARTAQNLSAQKNSDLFKEFEIARLHMIACLQAEPTYEHSEERRTN